MSEQLDKEDNRTPVCQACKNRLIAGEVCWCVDKEKRK